MNFTAISNTIISTVNRMKFTVDKHGPEILLATGIASGIAATVTACRSTLKVDEVLEPCKEKVEKIHEVRDGQLTINGEYTEKDASQDLVKVYAKTGIELAKLYGPSIILGGISIGCLVGSHHVLSSRNAGLAAAYAGLDAAYKQYRKNVKDILGEDADYQIANGLKADLVKENYVDEDGKRKKRETQQLTRVNDPAVSPYAIFFDDGCKGWTKNAELNKAFILTQISMLNELLDRRGHVLVNDVREAFGLKRTSDGSVMGWVKSSDDVHIDLGLDNVHKVGIRDFMNGYEPTVILEPTGIEYIWDRINEYSWI